MNNIPEFSVSEFSRNIKRVVEDAFGYVRIRGEISGFKKSTVGHVYFSLKDEFSLISAVCFRNAANLINFEIGDGLEVVASGQVTTYEGRSNYQIIVDKIEIAGVGALMQAIEKRKQKLLEEGLFDQKHKKSLPAWPAVIGVITSPTGAVIEDILHRIENRFPTQVLLYPSAMQGKTAALEVIAGIKYFNNRNVINPDVIIIARGGGSFEDLLPFNDENLAREVFKSKIPIVSAIGHETDTTIIDFVSDLRAPTPSAAAELITPLLNGFKDSVTNFEKRLKNYFANLTLVKSNNLEALAKFLIHPNKLIDLKLDRLKDLEYKITTALFDNIKSKEQRFVMIDSIISRPSDFVSSHLQKLQFLIKNLTQAASIIIKSSYDRISLAEKLLVSYDYKMVLKRGYALIKNSDGELISSLSKLKNNQIISIEMSDGEFDAAVLSGAKELVKKSDDDQNNLLF